MDTETEMTTTDNVVTKKTTRPKIAPKLPADKAFPYADKGQRGDKKRVRPSQKRPLQRRLRAHHQSAARPKRAAFFAKISVR